MSYVLLHDSALYQAVHLAAQPSGVTVLWAFLHDAANTHHSLLWPHLQCDLHQHRSTHTTWSLTGVSSWKHQNVQHTDKASTGKHKRHFACTNDTFTQPD